MWCSHPTSSSYGEVGPKIVISSKQVNMYKFELLARLLTEEDIEPEKPPAYFKDMPQSPKLYPALHTIFNSWQLTPQK